MLNMWGMGRFVYWNVKYYLFCRKIVPVSKGNVSPSWFFFLVLQSITFCMSSLLLTDTRMLLVFAWFLLLTCLDNNLMFLLLLPTHLAYKSKVNAHTFLFFFFFSLTALIFIGGDKFSCLLSYLPQQSKLHILEFLKKTSRSKLGPE